MNRCLFWFHPLAWMLELRLALLAEQACDEAAVATLGDRNGYAHILLEMASVVDGSHGRMRCHALTMAAGSHIRRRIDLVLEEGRTFSRGLTWAGWTAVLLCGVPLVLCAGAVELAHQPPLAQIEIPRWTIPAPPLPEQRVRQPKSAPLPVMLAQAKSAPASPAAQSDVAPRFTVASIQPATQYAGTRVFGLPWQPDAGRLSLAGTLELLIGNANQIPLAAISGPDWIKTQRYEVTAQYPAGTTQEQFCQMLGSLLFERFGLVIHRETKDVTGYQLTVAPDGLKLRPTEPSTEADADAPAGPARGAQLLRQIRPDADGFPILPPGMSAAGLPSRGGMTRMTFRGVTMGMLAHNLGVTLSTWSGGVVPVTDQTGLDGRFDFHVEYPALQASPNSRLTEMTRLQGLAAAPGTRVVNGDPNVGPADISAALEKQLGLRLYPQVTKADFIVVEQVNSAPTDH